MQYHYAKVGFGISEYRTSRTAEIPVGLIIMQSPPPHYDWIANEDGTYSEVPKSTDEILLDQAKNEHSWVISELDNTQIELMYHWTGDTSRARATEQEWKDYAITLRNYTTTDEDGNPVIVGEERPIAPV